MHPIGGTVGGINHQPTSQVSVSFTVPAARALTKAVAELNLGNAAIEDVILTPPTQFGVSRQHLIDATAHFNGVVVQLGIVHSYVNRVIDTIGNDEYDPFDISSVDVDQLIRDAVADGLLADSAAVQKALSCVKNQGYTGIFFAIGDLVDGVTEKAQKLHDLTFEMIDGPEGKQGYFWINVESNKTPWRQYFMQTFTSINELLAFWATTALICTEVHLMGISAPSILEYHSKV